MIWKPEKWLITNVTAVACPIRAENEVFWTNFDVFCLFWTVFVVEEPLCDLKTPSRVPKTLRPILVFRALLLKIQTATTPSILGTNHAPERARGMRVTTVPITALMHPQIWTYQYAC